jgi:hypothetical protein
VATVVVFSVLLISALKTCQYGEREVSMTGFENVLFTSALQHNISPLYSVDAM